MSSLRMSITRIFAFAHFYTCIKTNLTMFKNYEIKRIKKITFVLFISVSDVVGKVPVNDINNIFGDGLINHTKEPFFISYSKRDIYIYVSILLILS